MIVACPNCGTRYAVAADAIGADGRTVRCAACRHTWFQTVPPGAAAEAAPGFVHLRPSAAEAAAAAHYRGNTLPARLDEPPPRRRGSGGGWAFLILLVAGLVAVGYVGRDQIVRLWPPSALLYERLGVALPGLDDVAGDPIGPGLVIRGFASELTEGADGRVLTVRGEIVNESALPRRVPRLRAALSDGEDEPLQSWTFDIGRAALGPGEAVTFESRFEDPPEAGTLVEVTADPTE